MKKQKLSGLSLNKTTISKLGLQGIVGGGHQTTSCISCEVDGCDERILPEDYNKK